ncbi:MAG: hypothetical protein IPJ00_02185 [Saprospirales bacterium]|nr:hypothetical protein [Saprospirales bacterium]
MLKAQDLLKILAGIAVSRHQQVDGLLGFLHLPVEQFVHERHGFQFVPRHFIHGRELVLHVLFHVGIHQLHKLALLDGGVVFFARWGRRP